MSYSPWGHKELDTTKQLKQENKICPCSHFSLCYLPRSDGTGCHDLSVFNAEFQVSSFTLLFHPDKVLSFLSLSAIGVVSSIYLRLLIFLPGILIPAFVSSSPAFCMMYSAYELNKQGDHIQSCHTPFPTWNQSVVPCLVLTVAP